MNTQSYTDLARTAWNEAAPIHWRTTSSLVERFADPATNFITLTHKAELERIGLKEANVAQLNCNNGRELISLLRLGASRGTGFDISDDFIEQAKKLADAANVPAEFVATNVYEIDPSFDGSFDLVVVTSGALCFMPDLGKYFDVVSRLLRKGGTLNIYDCHPLTDMLELDRDRGSRSVQFVRSYFDRLPVKHTSGLDYIGSTTYAASDIFYFHHTLADILRTCLKSGFRIEHFDETPEDPSGAFPRLATSAALPPLSFMLTAKKES